MQYYTWNTNEDYDAGAVGASGMVLGMLTTLTCVMPRSSVMLLIVLMLSQ